MKENLHNCVNTLTNEKKIYVEGYVGSWSVIDDCNGYVLLEHNTYGDETCYLVVKARDYVWKKYKTRALQEVTRPFFSYKCVVYETFDDIRTCLQDAGII